MHFSKYAGNLGHDERHQDKDNNTTDKEHSDGISKRGANLAVQRLLVFAEVGQLFQNQVDCARGFSGLDHIDIKRREDPRKLIMLAVRLLPSLTCSRICASVF